MSTTDVYLLYKTKTTHYRELRNGYGSGPAIWALMTKKYLGRDFSMWGDHDDMWKLPRNADVEEAHRITMAATYDGAYIPVANLAAAADALEKTHDDIIRITDMDWSHWKDIAEAMREADIKHDHRLVGVAISCTSVSDQWSWRKPEELEAWDGYEYATVGIK